MFNQDLFNLAQDYCQSVGLSYTPMFTSVSDAQGKQIADAFIDASDMSGSAVLAYEKLKAELLAQFNWISEHNITIIPWQEEGQPYANSREVFEDVLNNKRLFFFLTSEGFGEEQDYSTHPLLEKTGIVLNGQELCYNDLFRAVHDVFGHAIWGHQFGPQGETKAWQSHLAMFVTLEAKLALSTETQGQTCWFNYGPHLRRQDGSIPARGDADYIPLQDRPYAIQKVSILPSSVFNGLTQLLSKELSNG